MVKQDAARYGDSPSSANEFDPKWREKMDSAADGDGGDDDDDDDDSDDDDDDDDGDDGDDEDDDDDDDDAVPRPPRDGLLSLWYHTSPDDAAAGSGSSGTAGLGSGGDSFYEYASPAF